MVFDPEEGLEMLQIIPLLSGKSRGVNKGLLSRAAYQANSYVKTIRINTYLFRNLYLLASNGGNSILPANHLSFNLKQFL
jgi:hypothetical protein